MDFLQNTRSLTKNITQRIKERKKKLQNFTFDGITSMTLHAVVSGFGEECFICTDIDSVGALFWWRKGGMVVFLAQAHKEDSTGIEGLKGVGKLSPHKIEIIWRNGSAVISQIWTSHWVNLQM